MPCGVPFGGGKHNYISGQPGFDGTTNRGGGGGGRNAAGGQQIGSNGGSGIIVGRYLG